MANSHSISEIEPLMPDYGMRELEDLTSMLIAKSSKLASGLKPEVTTSIGDLVRSMNCYYSNLIEGHNTHPRDIERALKENFSKNKEKRDLQLEAKAHIKVQEKIDKENIENVTSPEYISWIHKQFYDSLPEQYRLVKNHDTGKIIEVIPGEFRTGTVTVGRHIPPKPESLNNFLNRFNDAYNPIKLSKVKQVIAAAASHHRLLWIHPFYDGNGRVTRLFSHSYLKSIDIGCSLWSVSRGLARESSNYKQKLDEADSPRQGDFDGRGNLSEKGLSNFCKFFLERCIDQVDFMSSILEPSTLLKRIESYCDTKVVSGDFHRSSFSLISYILLNGNLERNSVPKITGLKERQARKVLSTLLNKGILTSKHKKDSVRLGFPSEIFDSWFPRLYPSDIN